MQAGFGGCFDGLGGGVGVGRGAGRRRRAGGMWLPLPSEGDERGEGHFDACGRGGRRVREVIRDFKCQLVIMGEEESEQLKK